ncbi:hypothetical protein HAZT_HAZT008053 [Hyalella azteca]|uniref:RNase H type-1 domain-containing protein n=1 Tax=Hyalella azteca TaxID=294128 RepID=A0A6A0GZ52_HYAAZ|nr:hypothetical protein HAZT_HAZT008053 [Hyalella azteca]
MDNRRVFEPEHAGVKPVGLKGLRTPDSVPHKNKISDWLKSRVEKKEHLLRLEEHARWQETFNKFQHNHKIPMTVHVYHSYRQPNSTNHCTPLNGLCTHLCLPAPQVLNRVLNGVLSEAPRSPSAPPATGVRGWASGREEGDGPPPSRGTSALVVAATAALAALCAAALAAMCQKYTVTFCWVPGHVRVAGNEAADELSRNASARETPHWNETVPYRDHYV